VSRATRFSGRVCVVTGAANGMGRAFALALAREGALLAACDIDDAGLESLRAEPEVAVRSSLVERVDVADAEARARFIARVEAALGPVDLLVNNAGVGAGGPFVEIAGGDWTWLRAINLDAPVDLMRLVIPGMVARGRGHILNIASIAGLVAFPYISTYVAAKHAIVGLSRTLHHELKPKGVSVTVACPGIVRTGILDRGRAHGIDLEELRKIFRFGIEPDVAVRRMLNATRRGKERVIPNHDMKAVYFLYRLCPAPMDALVAWIAHRMFERQGAGVPRA
jgi:2-hydroxycyclohexanecarboxyl-CoA dehydrogenase